VRGRPCGGRHDEGPRTRRSGNMSACRRPRRLRKLSLPPQVAVTASQARTGFAGLGYNLCKDAAAFESKRATLTRRAPRLVKSQCTCSSGFSRVMLVTVGHCFKCDRPLVALAVVSNRGYPSKKAHLFHADIQRVQPPVLRLAIRSRCGRGGFDCMMQKRAGIESITDHANGP